MSSVKRLERRQSSRIRIFGDLHGRVVQMDVLVILRDISTGGFAIESPQMFQAGAEHTVELTAPTGKQFVAMATVRQCVRQVDSEDVLPVPRQLCLRGLSATEPWRHRGVHRPVRHSAIAPKSGSGAYMF